MVERPRLNLLPRSQQVQQSNEYVEKKRFELISFLFIPFFLLQLGPGSPSPLISPYDDLLGLF